MRTILRCASVRTGRGTPLGPSEISVLEGVIERIIPLGGGAPPCHAIPSFFDAHCHLLWMGMEKAGLDLSGCRSAADMLDALAGAPAGDDGAIVRGEKWDESSWSGASLPSLDELDSASRGRPVMLRRVCGHAALVNSAMLGLLRSRAPGTSTSGGAGSALVVEGPVLRAYELFPPTDREFVSAMQSAAGIAFSEGVTGLATTESPGHALMMPGILPPELSVSVSVFADDPAAWPDAWTSGRVAVRGAKMFLDGGLGARTASTDLAYSDGSSCAPCIDGRRLALLVGEARSRGLVPVVHAIGTRALRLLDSAGMIPAGPGQPPEIRVEHAEDLEPAWPGTWRRDVHVFSMQPNFVRRWQGPGGMYAERLGEARARRLNPFALPLAAGFRLGFGSDGMPFGPLWGIRGAIGHPEPSFRLRPEDALNAYTLEAASISGFGDIAGPLAPGRRADLVLLDGDPGIPDTDPPKVLLTMAGGRIVHLDAGLPGGSLGHDGLA